MKKNLLSSAVILAVTLFVVISSCLALSYKSASKTVIDLKSMTSDLASYDEDSGTWVYSPADTEDPSGNEVLLRGPFIRLDKGCYTAHISYSSSRADACKVYSDSSPDAVYASNVRLEPFYGGFGFDFELKEDVDDLEFAVVYTGGSFDLNGITVESNNNGTLRAVALTNMAVILLGMAFLLRDRIRKNVKSIVTAALIAFAVSIPLLHPAMSHGHDFNFHAMRIEGIAEGLMSGQFPVRMSSLWLGGYGYPVSVYYGDILLYFPAVLRIFGFSVNAAYKFYILAVNIMCASVSYACFIKIFRKYTIATVTTVLYLTASFRFVDCYVRTTLGEIAALVFLPVVSLAIYRIYTDEITDKRYMSNSFLLAAGMSGLILTHLITTELVCFILVLAVLINFKKTFRYKTFMCFAAAVGETVLFTLSFTVPFIHYSSSVETYIQAWMKYDSNRNIQQAGASIKDLFRFFGSWFGMGTGNSERMSLTPGILLMAVLAAAAAVIIMRKGNKKIISLSFLSLLTLWLSSNLYPWDLIEKLPFGESLVAIQFPWRYLGISVILLTLLAGELMLVIPEDKVKMEKAVLTMTIAGGVIMSGIFMYHYLSEGYFTHYVDTHSLDISNTEDAEYIMTGTDLTRLVYDAVPESGTAEITGREATSMEVKTVTDSVTKVSVPLFAYPGYETSSKTPIIRGDNNMVTFEVPAGENTTVIQYKEPLFYRIAEIINLAAAAAGVWYYRKLSRSGSV